MGSLGNDQHSVFLPEIFCWTKFGDEAGEAARAIFQRKEVERKGNRGTFLWGIGQSIRPSLLELLRIAPAPRVLFSPMRSAAARHDVSPSSVVVWSEGVGLDGLLYVLPEHSLVTSRRDDRSPRDYHFALVCECTSPITVQQEGSPRLRSTSLRNLISGSPVGSSQVTSVVRRSKGAEGCGAEYPVVATARLVAPYLVRLTRGVVVSSPRQFHHPGRMGSELAANDLLRLRRAEAGVNDRVGATSDFSW